MARSKRAAGTFDAYEAITSEITAALERGVVPWRQPWRLLGHQNAISKRAYRGINPFVLTMRAHREGYGDPRWLTYKQAQGAGGHVVKGERGTRIVFWRFLEREDEDTGERRRIPLLRAYTVFNVAQCEGLELPALVKATAPDPIAAAERIIEGYADAPTITNGATAAYYTPDTDTVHLPARAAFDTADGFYATLFHELGHSTGHASRLDRASLAEAAPFGSESYSREELIAELTAAFLCGEAGLDPSRLEQSAAYVGNWLKALKGDKRAIVVAAGAAHRAADRILGREAAAESEGVAS